MAKIFIILFFIFYYIRLNIIYKKTINNIKVCLCTIGKKENLYVKEYVDFYKNKGVDKIFSNKRLY